MEMHFCSLYSGSTVKVFAETAKASNSVVIPIDAVYYDSGAPIYNAESYKEDRDAVYAALADALAKAYPQLSPNSMNLDAPVNYTFTFEYSGEPYLGKVVSTPTGNRQWYSYALARPVSGQLREIRELTVQYTAIYAAFLTHTTTLRPLRIARPPQVRLKHLAVSQPLVLPTVVQQLRHGL